jgi:predicted PurR-regulated permease PerM
LIISRLKLFQKQDFKIDKVMDEFVIIIIVLIVLVLIIALSNKIRNFYAWWRKTDELIKKLDKNNELLQKILEKLTESGK